MQEFPFLMFFSITPSFFVRAKKYRLYPSNIHCSGKGKLSVKRYSLYVCLFQIGCRLLSISSFTQIDGWMFSQVLGVDVCKEGYGADFFTNPIIKAEKNTCLGDLHSIFKPKITTQSNLCLLLRCWFIYLSAFWGDCIRTIFLSFLCDSSLLKIEQTPGIFQS